MAFCGTIFGTKPASTSPTPHTHPAGPQTPACGVQQRRCTWVGWSVRDISEDFLSGGQRGLPVENPPMVLLCCYIKGITSLLFRRTAMLSDPGIT